MLSAEVTGDLSKIRTRMNGWRRRVEGDLLNRVAQRIAKQTRHRIRREKSSPDGQRWAPRKDSRESHPLLQKTRKMERSIKAARESKTLITIGSPIEYTKFHQGGTRKMVSRPIFGLSRENADDIEALIKTWVEKHLR